MTSRHRAPRILGILLAGAALPSLAHAHADLLSPRPRSPLALKSGPCGGVPRTGEPFVAEAGSTLEVTWEETIEHPGYFRLLFSKGNDLDFQVLLDGIPDKKIPAGQRHVLYSATIVLPAEPCDAGTLQLIQVMTENPSFPSYYYSCADMRLTAPGPSFRRGDSNTDGDADISDAIALLFFLFLGEGPLPCPDSADADDDGELNVPDPIAVLQLLFLGSDPLPPPGAMECGPDPTGDDLPPCELGCP